MIIYLFLLLFEQSHILLCSKYSDIYCISECFYFILRKAGPKLNLFMEGFHFQLL